MIGGKIGHYEIIELMGVGGMGEVYRARDLTLDRQVAIKVLPEEWSEDGDRLARLQREAKVLAQLDHTNIAAIHGLEEATAEDGSAHRLLIMQLAEGDMLSDWIGTGTLSSERAMQIGLQIAAGIEAAHERGVVHRDLKPANVKVAEDAGGHPHVKLLDFGLAKAYEADGSASDISPEMSASPTVLAATRTGIILGTAGYMSPEQARGKKVDKRADIWSFGVVMFEMLTGRKLFDGDTVSDILAGVLKSDPDFGRLPSDTPPRVARLLERCLEKDPTKRLRDIGEARLVLANPEELTDSVIAQAVPDATGEHAPVAEPAAGSPIARMLPWAVAVAAIAFAAYSFTARPAATRTSFELAIDAPVDSAFQFGVNSGNVIISPDGTQVAFAALSDGRRMLWVRPLDEDEPFVLPGTENVSYPFWSPDSGRIGFFAQGQLKTVDVSGGIPEVVANANQGRGGTWGDDGTILFTPNASDTIFKVDASGGDPVSITTFDEGRQENAHYWAEMLPGSEHFLYFARGGSAADSGIYWTRVDGTTEPLRVVTSMSSGTYAPPFGGHPGHLLWVREDTLLAQPFDPNTGQLSGEVTEIASGVRVQESQRALFASASNNGVLAWALARAAENEANWYNREGLITTRLDIGGGMISQISVSPDGNQMLFSRPTQGTADVWLHDVEAGTTRAVVSTASYDELPTWSYDGASFLYVGQADTIYRVDASGAEESVALRRGNVFSGAVLTPDGEYAVFSGPNDNGDSSLIAVRGDGSGEPTFLDDGSVRSFAMGFSPDGRWILITSNRSNEFELWAAPFVTEGDTVRLEEPWYQVSTDGAVGIKSVWSPDNEILFVANDGYVTSVRVEETNDGLELGRGTPLFQAPPDTQFFDFASDGQQVVIVGAPYADGQTIRVLTNWQSRLPTGR